MFWRFSYSSSQIQTLLEKEDVTLQEVINEDDVLQECKSNNEKLIEFLTEGKNMETLLAHVVALPREEDNTITEKTCFKNATIACELLTCDIPAINDAFFDNIELTETLYSFMANEPPLNPLLASYFAKIIGSLILRKTDQFLDYIQAKEDFASLFLKHINTSAIMDILLRFLTTIDNFEMKRRVLEWLNKIKIIENIIELFSHEYSSEVHSNAAQILCDIIRISREQIKITATENDMFFTPEFNINVKSGEVTNEMSGVDGAVESMEEAISKEEGAETEAIQDSSDKNKEETDSVVATTTQEAGDASLNKSSSQCDTNPLLSAIENSQNVDRLFELMFASIGTKNCSLKDGIDVLLTLIDENTFYNQYSADTSMRGPENIDLLAQKGVQSVLQGAIKRMPLMHNFLKTFQPRVGFGIERLYVTKLIARLVNLNSVEFHTELITANTMTLLFDFMFEYPRNNFLHTQIASIVKFLCQSIASAGTAETPAVVQGSQPLLEDVLKNYKLVQKLTQKWTEYFDQIDVNKNVNKVCYIGHMVVITNLIWNCNTTEEKNCSVLKEVLEADTKLAEDWKNLNETKVKMINEKFSKDLVRNPYNVINNDSNSESEMFELQNNEKINKKYAEFQREMKINCLDNFSLSENHIIASQPKFPDLFNKLQSVSFQMDSSDDTANLFEQICSQKDNMCLNSDAANQNLDEDAWVSKEIKFSETFNSFSSKTKENVMDISEDDYYLDGNKKQEENADKSSLTKTLFGQKNNSSLTSSSSSDSSDEEDQMRKRTATIFKIDEPMESSTTSTSDSLTKTVDSTTSQTELVKNYQPGLEPDLFQVDKNSELELFSHQPSEGEKVDSVGWADFSAFDSAAPSETKPTVSDVLPLTDPWTASETQSSNPTVSDKVDINFPDEAGAAETTTQAPENWANFD